MKYQLAVVINYPWSQNELTGIYGEPYAVKTV